MTPPLKSTQTMRDDVRVWAEQNEQGDGSVLCILDDLEALLHAMTEREKLADLEGSIALEITKIDDYITLHCQGDAPAKVYSRNVAEGRRQQASLDLDRVSLALRSSPAIGGARETLVQLVDESLSYLEVARGVYAATSDAKSHSKVFCLIRDLRAALSQSQEKGR